MKIIPHNYVPRTLYAFFHMTHIHMYIYISINGNISMLIIHLVKLENELIY